MSEELQDLLRKIQEDGVEKAENEAARIVSSARDKANEIVNAAEQKAKTTAEQAEQQAAAFAERGRKSLEQAARDVVLSVGEAVSRIFTELARRETGKAVTDDTLRRMLVVVVEDYCKNKTGESRVQILLNSEQQGKVVDFFTQKFSEELRKGLELKEEPALGPGFRVAVADGEIEHDFSAEAIADALCQLARPELAEIVRSAVGS